MLKYEVHNSADVAESETQLSLEQKCLALFRRRSHGKDIDEFWPTLISCLCELCVMGFAAGVLY